MLLDIKLVKHFKLSREILKDFCVNLLEKKLNLKHQASCFYK